MVFDKIKQNKWYASTVFLALFSIFFAFLHSRQDGSDYVDGPLLYVVTCLFVIVALVIFINLLSLVIYAMRRRWSQFFLTCGVVLLLIILWLVAFFLDFQIALLDP